VLFGKWSGTEVKIDGEELLIMKESDIMGVIAARPQGGRIHPGLTLTPLRIPTRKKQMKWLPKT
jgi:hypothetical protein